MARNRYNEDEAIKYKFNKSSLRKVLWYVKPYKKTVVTMTVLMAVMSFVALLPPMLNTFILDYVATGKGGLGLSALALGVVIVGLVAVAVYSDTVFTYFRTLFMTKTGHSIVHDMRFKAFERLQKFAFDYFDNRPNGKILARLTSYLDEMADVFANSFVLLIVDMLRIVIILIWLFVIDFRLALIILAAVVPMSFVVMLLRTVLTRRHRVFRNKRSNRTAFIAENIQGHGVVKAFNRIDKNTAISSELNDEVRKSWDKVIRVNELHMPVMDGFFYIGLAVVYVVVLFMATGTLGIGSLTLGKVIGFISYMGMISGPLNEITSIFQQLSRATSNLESVFDIIETEPTVKDRDGAEELLPVEGNVLFDHVYFSYDNSRMILEDVSFEIPAGRSIALVGPTGAGKSTVVNLLSRFYDLNAGRILIDGQDIAGVTLYSLRKQVGVMMQDSFIFSGTIIENIRYGKPDATDEACIEAARRVHADAFIESLPDGYYTETIEQGAKLSTGERQLISFARVILTDPKILILDEATASIDTHTEALIKEALDVILAGRTSFVIAHRLSTIQKSDCIFYIANKGIAEAGTHAQLMEKRGYYYKLVMSGHKELAKDPAAQPAPQPVPQPAAAAEIEKLREVV
ncbi:MAG: ABC transporter ATP-binding protein/permease [Clostridiales bacterium]|jgi:ATP-binding cassette subfamily B protein|nr:ABC transporter ATP-binding protein/permease [Clostridiales bacterium]